jgi:hypothetical protein
MHEEAAPKDHFVGWLILLFLLDFLYGACLFCSVYFFSESVLNSSRWWEFSIFLVLTIFAFAFFSVTNKKMSFGPLGSDMQKLRTSRFSVAFISLTCSCLLGALFLFLIEQVFFLKAISHPFGALAALLDSLTGVFLFFHVYLSFEGRGISRL